MSVDRELQGLEEAVAMAQAAFDDAVALRHLTGHDRTLRPGVSLCHAQLGAARVMLQAMRMRLIARVYAARLPAPQPPLIAPPPAVSDIADKTSPAPRAAALKSRSAPGPSSAACD